MCQSRVDKRVFKLDFLLPHPPSLILHNIGGIGFTPPAQISRHSPCLAPALPILLAQPPPTPHIASPTLPLLYPTPHITSLYSSLSHYSPWPAAWIITGSPQEAHMGPSRSESPQSTSSRLEASYEPLRASECGISKSERALRVTLGLLILIRSLGRERESVWEAESTDWYIFL